MTTKTAKEEKLEAEIYRLKKLVKDAKEDLRRIRNYAQTGQSNDYVVHQLANVIRDLKP